MEKSCCHDRDLSVLLYIADCYNSIYYNKMILQKYNIK